MPFTVVDQESDAVRVLFEWRRLGQSSVPDLGTTDPVQLAALVRDPSFRRYKQVCAPSPTSVGGQVRPCAIG
jgi:hypothetical protein